MTPDELTYLKELHEQARPAPWRYRILPVNLRTGDQDSCLVDGAGDEFATNVDEEFSANDFDVVLEARNALPHLLEHIDRLTRRLEIYEAGLGRVARNHPEAYAEALAGDAQ